MLVKEKIDKQSREGQIMNWYEEVFPAVCNYIQKRGGDLEEARELFQEAIILYYEKMVTTSFQAEISDQAYLMGIVKNLWLKYHHKEKRKVGLENMEFKTTNESKPLAQKLLLFLQESGEKCMDLLQTYYYEKLSMKEIAKKFGYKSERSATVQKFKCLEKVRENVKQKSLGYEDFID